MLDSTSILRLSSVCLTFKLLELLFDFFRRFQHKLQLMAKSVAENSLFEVEKKAFVSRFFCQFSAREFGGREETKAGSENLHVQF